MKIYVARHGQTAWNALNKTCGTTDLPLNELGLQQAEEVEEFISSISDPLVRQIVVLRVVDGRSWRDIAQIVGGDNSEDSVRMMFNRSVK